MRKHYQVNIWFAEKRRAYPRVKYYKAETTKEVNAKVKEEFPNCKEFLVMEVLTPHDGETEIENDE